MVDDFAAVAVAQPSSTPAADAGRIYSGNPTAPTFADRADRGVELLSRWAGITTFVATVGVIAWLVT